MNKYSNTLSLVDDFFRRDNIEFWLEAGTALGAYRDQAILPWDHDIDIAIWFKDLPSEPIFKKYFESKGFDVVFQKNFIYLDNIVQLKLKDKSKEDLIDVDIYLYKEFKEYAVMRWINSPIGVFSKIKQKLLFKFNKIINTEDKRFINNNFLYRNKLLIFFFKIFLFLYINTTKCYCHKFPINFFKKLQIYKLYGIEVKIPYDIEDFLEYRYGSNWKNKDKNYNQSGKWKKASARKKVLMNFLSMPEFRE
tara:strand:+ start:32351 stop:33100 length:750 start_codon:yes stop_codon:yes gene_type:complete